MTLQQMANVKRWHQAHRREHEIEYQVWDIVLTCWVLGWVGVPPAVVLAPRVGLAACALLSCMPEAYCWLRRWLHRRGRLRCDWLACAAR
jgi:hypothetical protein